MRTLTCGVVVVPDIQLYSVSLDFREKQRDLRSLHFRLLGRSGQYSENRPRDSRFEYALARGICSLQDQACFRIAWRLPTNIKCFREPVSMIIFLDILKTDSVRHSGEVLIRKNGINLRLSCIYLF